MHFYSVLSICCVAGTAGCGVALSHPRVSIFKGMVSREEEIPKSNMHTLQEEYWVKRVRTQNHEDPYIGPVHMEVTQCLPEEMTL